MRHDRQRRWEAAGIAGLAKLPQLAAGYAVHQPIERAAVGTLAITKDRIVFIAPTFFDALCDACLAFARAHEEMHPALRHFARLHGQRGNIAGDLAINPVLQAAGIAPCGVCMQPLYPAAFGLPDGLCAEEYLARLPQELPPCGVDAGQCGSGAGNTSPGEDAAPGDDEEAVPNVSGLTNDRATESVVGQCARALRKQGHMPATFKRELDSAQPIEHVESWTERLLRVARRSLVSHRQGRAEADWNRRPRRLPLDRRILTPASKETLPRVAVAIDTSASMSPDNLRPHVDAVRKVLRRLGNIRVLTCDAAIHADIDLRHPDALEACLIGGGGTDFQPVFHRLASRPPDVLVFVTDGYGTAPALAPAYPVIWQGTPGGTRPAPWGDWVEVT